MSPARERRASRGGDGYRQRVLIWVLVAVATALAVALRLYQVGQWSFWIDEAHTYRDATMPLLGEHNFWEQDRAWYPLTFLGLRFLLDASPDQVGEGWLRLPFALFGALTVPVIWWCGRRIVGQKAAVFAAFMLAIMPWHLFWSQSARGYVFVVLMATFATGHLWRWASSGKLADMLWTLAVIAFGALFHPTAVFQVFGVVAFVVLRRLGRHPPRIQLIVLAVGLAAFVSLPWLIEQLAPIQGYINSKGDVSVLHFVSTAGYYFRPMLIAIAAVGCVLLALRALGAQALMLACLAVVPILVVLVLGGALAQATARYAICALPPMLLLGAAAARELYVLVRPGRSWSLRVIACFAGLALVADFSTQCWAYYQHRHGDRARWREACNWVRRNFEDERVYVATVNEPSVAFYLTPDKWRERGRVDGDFETDQLVWWDNKGELGDKGELGGGVFLHEPGWQNHIDWLRERAAQRGARLVMLINRPKLEEIDSGRSLDRRKRQIDPPGALSRILDAEFELAQYLPCWVGPKDESIWILVPVGS